MTETVIIAQVTKFDAPIEGFVSAFPFDIAIVAKRSGGEWEPLYGIKRGEGRFSLPSCFALKQEFCEALTNAVKESV